ncbi:MAG: short-chain dehydrogenase/reductase [Pseudomonadota bacterium]
MELNLSGKKALITGGSAGIGLAIANALAEEGCNLILVSRGQAGLTNAAEQIRVRYGVDVTTEALDLAVDANAAYLGATYSDIDILVNNAGAIPGGELTSLSQAKWREGWDLKVFGFIGVTREFYSSMCQRGHGVIINVIGASATGLDHRYIAGSTGNAALEALTLSLGSSSSDHGVRVVGISPGLVLTERLKGILMGRAKQKLGDESRWLELTATHPFQRAANVEEIAATAAFLASPRSSYTSGTIVSIDGGFSRRHNWW